MGGKMAENSAAWENNNNSEVQAQPVYRETAKIKVIGIGGGGSNAVSRMFKEKLDGVEYYALNTDSQHLFRCDVAHRISLGSVATKGLGAGAQPEVGRQAADVSRKEIEAVAHCAATSTDN